MLLPLKDIIQKNNLFADKRLGQNFILDSFINQKIVRAAGEISDFIVLEVGPGPGGLTRELLNMGAKIVAIEKDDRFLPILKDLSDLYPNQMICVKKDALKFSNNDLKNIIKDFFGIENADIKIIANLPYNVGTQLLIYWLHKFENIFSYTLMFQKEVASRIISKPSSKDYGRLSILCQYLCNCKNLFDLPPQVFTPPPKVFSSMVQLIPKDQSLIDKNLLVRLEKLTMAAFGQRRKMLRSSLRQILNDDDICQILEKLDIQPTQRPENLNIQDFVEMAKMMP
jgi:16S rRNA (adenine1518-N6/adenine1519-N6)-dimethyltransferase